MSPADSLLAVVDVGCSHTKDSFIFQHVGFELQEGDIAVLQGQTGCGKSTLLKCLAHLNAYEGEVLYRGKSPKAHGSSLYRTHVLYVPQRPSLLPGTPKDFIRTIQTFRTQSRKSLKLENGSTNSSPRTTIDIGECMSFSGQLLLSDDLWDREWANLSGGEAQRIAFAIACGMRSTVLLLDEPTSALDHETTLRFEDLLTAQLLDPHTPLKAVVLVTHSEEQAQRIGTRFFRITAKGCQEMPTSAST